MSRLRLPGLELPRIADGATLAFFEAVKERLEVLTGERPNPLQRAVTIDDMKATGVVTVAIKNGYATLVGAGSAATSEDETQISNIENALSLFTIEAEAIDGDNLIVLYDVSTGSYRRISWDEFTELFVMAEDAYPPQLRHAGI